MHGFARGGTEEKTLDIPPLPPSYPSIPAAKNLPVLNLCGRKRGGKKWEKGAPREDISGCRNFPFFFLHIHLHVPPGNAEKNPDTYAFLCLLSPPAPVALALRAPLRPRLHLRPHQRALPLRRQDALRALRRRRQDPAERPGGGRRRRQ